MICSSELAERNVSIAEYLENINAIVTTQIAINMNLEHTLRSVRSITFVLSPSRWSGLWDNIESLIRENYHYIILILRLFKGRIFFFEKKVFFSSSFQFPIAIQEIPIRSSLVKQKRVCQTERRYHYPYSRSYPYPFRLVFLS